MKASNPLILAFTLVLLESCCVIFNSQLQPMLVVTDVPCKIEVSGDTSAPRNARRMMPRSKSVLGDSAQFQQGFIVRRSNTPIKITISNDSFRKTVVVKQGLSETFWLNFFSPLGVIGMGIDLYSQKKSKYPRLVFIDTQESNRGYLKYRPVMKPYQRLRNIIKFTPLKSIDQSNPAVEFSYERITGQNMGTQIMASQLTSLFNSTRGFRVGLEERLYLKPTAPSGPYIAFEFNYLNARYKTTAEFGKTRDSGIYLDSITIFKRTYNYNLKLGFQRIYKRFCIDAYIGIGVRYKNAIHYDRQNPNDIMLLTHDLSIYNESRHEGRYYTLSCPMNIRLGWLF